MKADALFPEFEAFLGSCRFDDCVHENEPGCAVRAALEKGDIKRSRYASYIKVLEAKREMEW